MGTNLSFTGQINNGLNFTGDGTASQLVATGVVAEKGDTGATGTTGGPGPKGADGTNGINGTNGANGQGVPVGGVTNQVLAKSSNTDFATTWVSQSVTSVNSRTGAVTGLAEASDVATSLAGKANTTHTHTEADVTNLTSDLSGKASTVHTHTESDVTGLVTDLGNKVDKVTGSRLITSAESTLLGNTSGTNTGDNATNSQYSGLAASKQETLVSGTNIKTVNGTTLLGTGDVTISGGSGDVVGPSSATDSYVAVADGVTGKLIKYVPIEMTEGTGFAHIDYTGVLQLQGIDGITLDGNNGTIGIGDGALFFYPPDHGGGGIQFSAASITSDRTYSFPNSDGTIALTSDITGTNSGTNTGDQTLAGLGGLPLAGGTLTGALTITTGSSTGFAVLDSRASSTTGGAGLLGRLTTDPTATGHRLGFYLLGANGQNTAGMMGYSTEAWSGTARGTNLTFATTAATTTARTERYLMDENGFSPIATATYTLGTSSLYWSNLYATRHYLNSTAYLDGGTAGEITVTGTLNLPDTSSTSPYIIYAGSVKQIYIHQNKANFGMGTGSLNSGSLSGSNNTALGAYTLYANTTGQQNVGVGQGAVQNNTTGSYNTGVGQGALPKAGLGSYNVGIGRNVGANNTGSRNVFIGASSANTNTGSDNIFIGSYAGYAETGSNTFILGNVQQSNEANDRAYSLLYGTFSGTAGSLTGQQLTVNGALNIQGITAPTADSTYTLGSSSLYWSNTYTDRLYLNSTAYLDGGTAGVISFSGELLGNVTLTDNWAWEAGGSGIQAAINAPFNKYQTAIRGSIDNTLSSGNRTSAIVGLDFTAKHAQARTIGDMYGATVYGNVAGTNAVATNVYGIAANLTIDDFAGQSVSNYYGVKVSGYRNGTTVNAATVSNFYSFYMSAPNFTNITITNRYGVYIDDTNATNVLTTTRPLSDSGYSLGDSSHYWSNTYTDRLYLNSTAYLDGAVAGAVGIIGKATIDASAASQKGLSITAQSGNFGFDMVTPANGVAETIYMAAQNRARFGYDGTGPLLDDNGATKRLRLGSGGKVWDFTAAGVFIPVQFDTASAPAYVKGGIYFDTTLNKLRVGGASAWETITSF